jgi:hypothetical protein
MAMDDAEDRDDQHAAGIRGEPGSDRVVGLESADQSTPSERSAAVAAEQGASSQITAA